MKAKPLVQHPYTFPLPMSHVWGPQSSYITDLFFIQMAGVLQTDLKCWLCLGHAYSVSLESHYSLISCGNEISASHCVQITWPLTPRTKSAFCQAGVDGWNAKGFLCPSLAQAQAGIWRHYQPPPHEILGEAFKRPPIMWFTTHALDGCCQPLFWFRIEDSSYFKWKHLITFCFLDPPSPHYQLLKFWHM